MKKFKDWLLKDWWLKIVSLLLAFVIWFVWIQIENPTNTKDFGNIKVTFTNTDSFDEDNKVYEVIDNTDVVKVSITAPKSVINSISASDIIAEADVSKMVDGVIPISFGLQNAASFDSITGNHDTVQLSIEDRARKYVSLVTFTEGEVAEGFLFNGVSLDQNMIEISGPQSAVDKVSYAGVNINIDEARQSISANMEISLYDASNKLVNLSSISKQSDSVHVSIEILDTKTVIVYAGKTGNPKDGYLYANDITITPAQVVIAGTTRALSSVSRLTITDPVDISGADGDVSQEFDLNQYLPEGISFADNDFDGLVTVTAHVEQKSAKVINISTGSIKLINVPQDANVTVSSFLDNISVNIVGLQSELNNVNDSNVSASVDVGSWMAANKVTTLSKGNYQMPVDIELPGNLTTSQNVNIGIKVE